MPITFDCACGKALRVPDEHAGRRVKCPACSVVGTVPAPEPKFEVIEDTSEPLAPPAPKARPVAKPATSRTDDDDDDDRAYGVKKSSRRDDDDDDEEEDRPRKKKKKVKRRAPPGESRGNSGGGSATGEIAGGLIAMLLGVVLIVLALSNGRIPIYGGVLFIAGLVGFFKGLAGGSGE